MFSSDRTHIVYTIYGVVTLKDETWRIFCPPGVQAG